ncbi:MAG TPA: GAF domain-containing protein, partial [Flavobacteriaceae bacterium]|nr:GAF domain-containing protein [Flavobacteriaceae bacterium]
QVDITNCDREPIHIIEKAQEHGVIVICDYKEDKIIQISDNCSHLLGIEAKSTISKSLESILPKKVVDSFYKSIQNKKTLYPEEIKFLEHKYLAIPHLTESRELIIDIEPLGKNIDQNQFQEELSKILKEIKETDTVEVMCHQTVSLIKELYGYDRVMMYRFDEEWNGEVVAEVREDHLESWLGLHYPATDIPKPAREIFLKQGVRMISDVNYTPSPLEPQLDQKINLSKSELRAVSPIHIEYLKNMNVGASLTAAVILNGKLWGLIACHHYSAKFINFHQRQSCKFLAQVFSNKLALKESKNFIEHINSSEKIRKQLLIQMNSVNDSTQALIGFNPKFTDLIECSGGAIYNDGNLKLIGKTPSEKQVKKIITKVLANQIDSIFYTKQLNRFYDKADKFAATASGILSIRFDSENSYIIWFRPESSTTVDWGGKPEKQGYIKDGVQFLHPRKSFERWTEKVSGIANPWQSYDIEAAENLQDTITNVLVKKQKDEIKKLNDSLVEVNKELETFSYSVSHDLRAPLRGIDGYSRILINNYIDNLDEYGQNALKTILDSAKEMDLLIEDILSYAKVGQNNLNITTFSTKPFIENIISSQNVKNINKNTSVEVEEKLPNITGDKRMISQVFSNLISNAVKYSSKEENPKIKIGATSEGNQTIFYVKDNGVGFDPSFKTKIFDVFSRANTSKDFTGSGIGLATVKKVIDKHNGEIWAESQVNQGASFYFYVNVLED